jgi:tRNA (guanine37-N1)-methyltransferase
MLSVDVLTLFPRMVALPLAESVLGKAQARGLLRVRAVDIREFAEGKHRVTDDVPYGGGAGMVMKPEPLTAAIEASRAQLQSEEPAGVAPRVVLLSPAGRVFSQSIAQEYSTQYPKLVLVCGRYEGVDERVMASVDEELSIGDFILTGGEAAALVVIEAVARLQPGVLGNDDSARVESFTEGLLEAPHYTRPPEFRGKSVPPELLSGNHALIARWRRKQALVRTRDRRPDLWKIIHLSDSDKKLLEET